MVKNIERKQVNGRRELKCSVGKGGYEERKQGYEEKGMKREERENK